MSAHRRNQLLVGLSLMAIIVAGVWWYLSGEYEDQLTHRPANSKLHTERFYVAQRWLQSRGTQTYTLYDLRDLHLQPHDNATLFVSTPPGHYNDLEAHRLFDWVQSGGHLVIPAPSLIRTRGTAPELNPDQIRACHECLMESEANDEDADDEPRRPYRAELHHLHPPGSEPLEIWSRYGLEIPEESHVLEAWPNQDVHPLVVRYDLGQGRITMLASWNWLDNHNMVHPDHARLLELLVEDHNEQVFFQQRVTSGGLLGWLWRQAPVLWLIAIGLAVLWVWSRWPRLGPIRDAGLGPDTRMKTHLLATARFDWQRHRSANLVAAMTEERNIRLRKRFPDWHRLDREERTDRLTRLLPVLDEEAVDYLLDTTHEDRTQPFIRLVRLHEQLMKVL